MVTLGTLVSLDTRVDAGVLCNLAATGEGLVAVVTLVGLLTSVYPHVQTKPILESEAFGTQVTPEGLFATVDGLVATQGSDLYEGGIANLALIGSVTCVNADML